MLVDGQLNKQQADRTPAYTIDKNPTHRLMAELIPQLHIQVEIASQLALTFTIIGEDLFEIAFANTWRIYNKDADPLVPQSL